MDSTSNKILYMETVDKREVALKSPNMEREGFKKSIDALIISIRVSKLVR